MHYAAEGMREREGGGGHLEENVKQSSFILFKIKLDIVCFLWFIKIIVIYFNDVVICIAITRNFF